MKKMMLVLVALLFSANFALADDYCEAVYDGTCLENVVDGPRLSMTVYLTNSIYPNCPITVYYRLRICTDANGNHHIAFKIEWWEINKGYPADCAAIYNALWDPNINRWDQVLYEQLLQQVDQEVSAQAVADIFAQFPTGYFDCDLGEHFVHITTTKTACYSPMMFMSYYNGTQSGCNRIILSQIACGDYGCCYEEKSYCQRNGIIEETITGSGYIPGEESGCGEIISIERREAALANINNLYNGCMYEIIYFGNCTPTCEQ